MKMKNEIKAYDPFRENVCIFEEAHGLFVYLRMISVYFFLVLSVGSIFLTLRSGLTELNLN